MITQPHITEKSLQDKLETWLVEYFDVYREVTSSTRCEGKRGRIDFIVIDPISQLPMGIEVKKDDSKRGNDLGVWVRQAEQYAKMLWPVNGVPTRIPIFIYPRLSHRYLVFSDQVKVLMIGGREVECHIDRHSRDHIHNAVNAFIGVYNVGELRAVNEKYRGFVFNNELIWSNEKDFHTKELAGIDVKKYKKIIERHENSSNGI